MPDVREVEIAYDRIFGALGYPGAEAVSEGVARRLPGLVAETIDSCRPAAIARIEDARVIGADAIQIVDGPCFRGWLLAKAMVPASRVALFALTLGRDVSEWIGELAVRDALDGFVADAIASELVEALADQVLDRLAREMEPGGLFPGPRYSPGYCDWPIDEMSSLLARIGSEEIGISLTSGGMMVPEKSICGAVGFGENSRDIRFIPCLECPEDDCPHRRGAEEG